MKPAVAARLDESNEKVIQHFQIADPWLIDIQKAGDVVPDLEDGDILHAGAPLDAWDQACGALRGSVYGALVHWGHAKDIAQAARIAPRFTYKSANDHQCSAAYATVIGPETPVLVVEDRATGMQAYAPLNEGRGRALRYGHNDPDTLRQLAWLEEVLASSLRRAIIRAEGLDAFKISRHALQMGDDGHSRQHAASLLLANALTPFIAETSDSETTREVTKFLGANEIFYLCVGQASHKSVLLGADGQGLSTIVSCIAANGVDFAIKVAGLPDRWFKAPLAPFQGRYFDGYGPEDAGPSIGDSAVAETLGFGAFAVAAAPALARYVGGAVADSQAITMMMYEVTLAESERMLIPQLDYRGTPLGIDCRRVMERGIAPVFNAGVAHKDPGVGQIGAGYGQIPIECFEQALTAVDKTSEKL